MVERRWITFTVGGYRFAVPIETVREVLNVASIVPVPGSRLPFEGILPYRENMVLPVFSLLDILGKRHDEDGSLVVVAGSVEDPIAFKVHSMGGVVVSSETDETGPYEGDLPSGDWNSGVLKKTGGELILLEVGRLFDS